MVPYIIPQPVDNNNQRPTIMWGDSLTHEAKILLRWYHENEKGSVLDVRAFPGTAPCDWIDDIRSKLQEPVPPRLIALAFYGNNFTTCIGAPVNGEMGYAVDSPEYAAKYQDSFDKIAAAANSRDVPVYWITPPPHHPSDVDPDLNDLISGWAVARGFTVIDAGAAVADGLGEWTEFLPCLVTEDIAEGCSGGLIKVRHDDLTHFEFLVEGDYTSYSSGATRWAAAAISGLPEFSATTEDCVVWSCPSA